MAFLECFFVSLRLGLISFGGPVAHIGYFQREYVDRLKWLSDEDFAELMALCQILPGPASSQLGAAIGVHRAGWIGGVAAWLGFTLPSAVMLIAVALGFHALDQEVISGVIDGLVVAAAAVVTLALWQMGQKLCPSGRHVIFAVVAFVLVVLVPSRLVQVGVIILACILGAKIFTKKAKVESAATGPRTQVTWVCLALFILGLVLSLSPFLSGDGLVGMLAALYEAGALVFGGGHVVLPLLEQGVVNAGLVDPEVFLAGYGVAQAVPGPLFTFGSYLGAIKAGWTGGILATCVIFLPGFLLLAAMLPQRAWLKKQSWASGAIAGAGATVVGLLAFALYGIFRNGEITSLWQVSAYVLSVGLLAKTPIPTWAVVLLLGGAGWMMG